MEKSPDAFRTISEVAELLQVPTHVLRFWETRFPQVRPIKRAGGRRYYRPADAALLGGIRYLLHDQGMTIRGVQRILREDGVQHVCSLAETLPTEDAAAETVEGVAASITVTAAMADQPKTRAVEPAPIAVAPRRDGHALAARLRLNPRSALDPVALAPLVARLHRLRQVQHNRGGWRGG